MARTAVKVRSTASLSSSACTRAARGSVWPASTSISATSSRARWRVRGERRSWAMASPAWRRPPISRSSRSSMPFRRMASSSYSSRTPRTGMRACRSPPSTAATAALNSPRLRLTLRLTNRPPARPSRITSTPAPQIARTMRITEARPSPMSVPTNRNSPLGRRICLPQPWVRTTAPSGSVSVMRKPVDAGARVGGSTGVRARLPVTGLALASISR